MRGVTDLDENEALVEQLFREHFALHIEKLPEGREKSSDFCAFDGTNRYLIELKTKYRNPEETSGRESQFQKGGTAIFSRSLERRSSVTKNISDAVAQIGSSDVGGEAFRIVFFLLRDFDADERWESILANLYGIESVVDWSDEGEARQCYYFNSSDNYRYRERLDATIIMIAESEKAVLCLNDHSPKYNTMSKSKLVHLFEDGVIDPIIMEETGDIWIVRGDIKRSSKASVIQYLREKYSLSERTMPVTMTYVSATTLVSNKRDT